MRPWLPVPATDMLRALPPNAALRSYTVTAKPRSANSCAALNPPTPPPRTATVWLTGKAALDASKRIALAAHSRQAGRSRLQLRGDDCASGDDLLDARPRMATLSEAFRAPRPQLDEH